MLPVMKSLAIGKGFIAHYLSCMNGGVDIRSHWRLHLPNASRNGKQYRIRLQQNHARSLDIACQFTATMSPLFASCLTLLPPLPPGPAMWNRRKLLWVFSVTAFTMIAASDRFRVVDASELNATAEGIAFFEAKIRPVLLTHCMECHSDDSEKMDGGLALDRRAGWQIGGDSGPAIEPGDSAASLLMSAIRYESIEMPPKGKLPDAVIADFEKWIDMGAPDPRDEAMPSGVRGGEIDWDAAAKFWAFRAPVETSAPEPAGDADASDWVDRFVASKRIAAGLKSPPIADPLVRLRRLCFDLTGLPPSSELIEAFRADPSEQHWRRIADRLLHSPEYAEHWGRHWLDVARYADSNGSDFNATFHDAWRYRDFVVRSFAQDKPFDRFVVQQVAGDLMEASDDEAATENLIATGFLMLGTKMLSERDKEKLEMDVVDDMIDTVGRSLLGLTLGCARCHDHKFDPVPTADYYALAGIFRSTQVLDGESQKYVSTWHKRPLPADPDHVRRLDEFEVEKKRLNGAIAKSKKAVEQAESTSTLSSNEIVFDDTQAKKIGDWQSTTYSKPYHGEGYVHDQNRDKGNAKITFAGPPEPGAYEVRIAFSGGPNRASNVPVILHLGGKEDDESFVRHFTINQRIEPAIDKLWYSLGEHTFVDTKLAQLVIHNGGTDGYVLADGVKFIRSTPASQSESKSSEQVVADAKLAADFVADTKSKLQSLEAELKQLEANRPAPLPMAMAVRDAAKIGDTFICVRGEVSNRGPEVPRGFLRICSSGAPPSIPEGQSGRLQLAHWLTDPDNPLTARVIVNRVWMHLFGEGIVRTVDNFGIQGERPSHPELLDNLAIEFVRDGWSIRRLVRRLVMTGTYSQSSQFNESAFTIDPDNRLLWRANRRRVQAESMRDTLLIAAGQLDMTSSIAPMAGFGVLVSQNVPTPVEIKIDQTPRRSIYLPVIRGELTPLLTTFDFADPDLIVGRRESTNVPSQGLTLLNNPDVIQWCRTAAERLIETNSTDQARLRAAYHAMLQRDPTDQESIWLTEFISGFDKELEGWAKAVQTLVASTEYRFLD
ncbi:MAG TPA: xanthan lyase [Planctomycetaceae bacterium]|nr:xanthan lyase [Planctomycetaceae bacterium]